MTTAEEPFAEPAPARLSYAIARFQTVLRAELARRLRAEGLTVPEFTALSVLSSREGLSNAQLARLSFVTPQAMNQVLASLEEKRLVSRRAPGARHSGHHRARDVRLTAQGRRRLRRAEAIVDAIEDIAFAELDPAQRHGLAATLDLGGRRLAPRTDPPGPDAHQTGAPTTDAPAPDAPLSQAD